MLHRCAPIVILCCLLSFSGCQPLLTQSAPTDKPWRAEIREALIQHLDADQWRLNTAWSPGDEARSRREGIPLADRLRWTHLGWRAAQGEVAEDEETALAASEAAALEADGSADRPPTVEVEVAALTEMPEMFRPELEPFGPRELRPLAFDDDLVGWNASILWAQLDPASAGDVVPQLLQLISEPPSYLAPPDATAKGSSNTEPVPRVISPALQAAAVDALCLVLAQSSAEPGAAMEPALELLGKPKLSEALRGELFRGIARRVPPRDIPRLKQALQYKSVEQKIEKAPTNLRRAAIDACLVYAACQPESAAADVAHDREGDASAAAGTPWPETLWNLQWDEDPHVRKTFGELLAVIGHPKAFEILKEQVLDHDLHVSQAALRSLGRLHTLAAKEELRKHARSRAESVRKYAVVGLAAWGEAELTPFMNDESHFVRCEAARQLGAYHSLAAASALRVLLTDPNPQVQTAAFLATEAWPADLAAPLLLQALGEGSLKTRQMALLQLEQRSGQAISFPLGGNRDERLREAALLAQRWQIPSETWSRLNQATPHSTERINELRLTEIQNQLEIAADPARPAVENAAALEWLRQVTAEDLPLLERLLPTAAPAAAELLYRDVLPRLAPHYQALLGLEERDIQARRHAAQLLAQQGAAASLPEPVVRRLREKLAQEQDRLVWRSAMRAVLQEDSPESEQLALLAVNHTWPDIRVLGCEYIAYHGKHAAALWLLPLFADSNSLVQIAAVRAAAQCHNPIVLDGPSAGGGSQGLRPCLISSQPQLQLAAASCMSQFGDFQAMQELIRFSLHDNWAYRHEAVQAMGVSGQTRFVEQLIRVAWTEVNPAIKQAAAASLNLLVAPGDRPDGIESAPNVDRQVGLWATWWEDRKRAAASPLANAVPAAPNGSFNH
jgi:HEAT repeat protein